MVIFWIYPKHLKNIVRKPILSVFRCVLFNAELECEEERSTWLLFCFWSVKLIVLSDLSRPSICCIFACLLKIFTLTFLYFRMTYLVVQFWIHFISFIYASHRLWWSCICFLNFDSVFSHSALHPASRVVMGMCFAHSLTAMTFGNSVGGVSRARMDVFNSIYFYFRPLRYLFSITKRILF